MLVTKGCCAGEVGERDVVYDCSDDAYAADDVGEKWTPVEARWF